MNYRMIIYLLGVVLLLCSGLMLLPMIVALLFEESVLPFVFSVLIGAAVALPCVLQRPKDTRIYSKEGFITVALSWIVLSLFGALPLVFSGTVPNYIDAFFETVSGFTTTGASIIPNVELVGRGINFWRCLTHWIGGMGVLVFMLAVMPSAGGQAIYLMRAEVPGTDKGKLVPKIRKSALILYGIYVALTLVQMIALIISGLSPYDAAVVSLSTAGTGGYGVLADSIAGYNNPAAEWIIAVFMLIFGVNFNVYFFLILGDVRRALKNEELRTYFIICTVATVILTFSNLDLYAHIGDSIRSAFFHAASIMTTTGFVTFELTLWSSLSDTVIFILMAIGACAGSTAGGFKVSRLIIAVKSAVRELRLVRRPSSVITVRLDGTVVKDETLHTIGSYVFMYVGILAVSTLLLSVDNFSFETNFSAALSTLNNVGPVLGEIGTFGSLASYSYFSKIVMCFNMLVGRLEIFPMLILFSPRTWKRG